MNHQTIRTGLFLLLALALAFPALGQRKKKGKTRYVPVENINRSEAWPIVAQAVASLKLGVEQFDYGKGELLTSYLEYKKGFIANRGKLLFNLKDNTLHVKVVQLQLKDAQTKKWKATYPDPLFPKEKQIQGEVAEAVRTIRSTPEMAEAATKGFVNNFYFHDRFFATATELAAELWFDQFLKDKKATWTLNLVDIQKSDKEGFRIVENLSGKRAGGLKVVRFTQSDANAFTNKGDRVKVSGVCASVEKVDGGWKVVMEDK